MLRAIYIPVLDERGRLLQVRNCSSEGRHLSFAYEEGGDAKTRIQWERDSSSPKIIPLRLRAGRRRIGLSWLSL